MKTKVRPTSIDTYHSHDFTNQQRAVLQAIKALHETCIADVAAFLGWERSTVSGRKPAAWMQSFLYITAVIFPFSRITKKHGGQAETSADGKVSKARLVEPPEMARRFFNFKRSAK